MTTTATEKNVLGRECKHAVYVYAQDNRPDDAVFVKEYVYYDDGTRSADLRMIENLKRPFWVTHPQFRNHQDKKFEEDIKKVQIYKSKQCNLNAAIGRVLGYRGQTLAMTCMSPYVYGTDISTPTLVKHSYMKRWPDYNDKKASLNTIAAVDGETNMFTAEEEPIMFSMTMKERAYLVVAKSFFEGHRDPEREIRDAVAKHIQHKIDERKIQLEIDFAENDGELCYKLIQKAHEWKPDIMDIWNVNFDIKKIIESLERHGYNLAQVFSDPSVPERYKYFKYREGKSQKETASGKFMALHPAEQWHVVECPASFYVLDSMCVYLKLRIAGGKEASYKLDDILKKHGCDGKFKFEPANHVKDGHWHRFMQERYKAEYCVYNLVDSIALEELDEVTNDLGRQISMQSGPSEYSKFPSQPRRTCDDLHFELQEYGYVIGSTGQKTETELDSYTQSLKHWIVTLPSHLMADVGTHAVSELPDYATKIYRMVADLDIEGTYPNEQALLNIGQNTTMKEVCKVEGLTDRQQRALGINLTGGFTNAVDICVTTMRAPTMETLLRDYRAHLSGIEPEPDPMGSMHEMMAAMMDEIVEESEEDEDEEEIED